MSEHQQLNPILKLGPIPSGQMLYFLEINPNGQWYFVQQKTNARIADAIADLLI